MLKFLVFLLSVFSLQASANDLFTKADIVAGKALVEQHCISCHASSYRADGSGIYTREDHKVKTSQGLVAQVRICSTMLGLKWFDEEEINVAAYLNQMYYKFEH